MFSGWKEPDDTHTHTHTHTGEEVASEEIPACYLHDSRLATLAAAGEDLMQLFVCV